MDIKCTHTPLFRNPSEWQENYKIIKPFSCSIFFVSTPHQQLVVNRFDELFWFPTIPLAEKSHKEDPWYWSAKILLKKTLPIVRQDLSDSEGHQKRDFSSAYNASKYLFFLRFRVWVTNLLQWFVTSHTNLHGTDRVSLISFFYAKFISTFLKIIFFLGPIFVGGWSRLVNFNRPLGQWL